MARKETKSPTKVAEKKAAKKCAQRKPAAKRTYNKAERQAYDMGRVFEAGRNGGRVEFKTEAEKTAFREGMKSIRG